MTQNVVSNFRVISEETALERDLELRALAKNSEASSLDTFKFLLVTLRPDDFNRLCTPIRAESDRHGKFAGAEVTPSGRYFAIKLMRSAADPDAGTDRVSVASGSNQLQADPRVPQRLIVAK